MDLDTSPGPSAEETPASLALSVIPKIDESMDNKPPKDKLVEVLDLLEFHVEKLRRTASQLEEDRDHLLSSLDSILSTDLIVQLEDHERDDVHQYTERIISRCLTVEVRVQTHRDKMQEDSLHQVNHLIDGLVLSVQSEPENAKAKCVSFMNACSPHVVHGITDKKFECALLGCTLDDQKRVKKRLQGLLHYFDKLRFSSVE